MYLEKEMRGKEIGGIECRIEEEQRFGSQETPGRELFPFPWLLVVYLPRNLSLVLIYLTIY
jgi:hypothetical protein